MEHAVPEGLILTIPRPTMHRRCILYMKDSNPLAITSGIQIGAICPCYATASQFCLFPIAISPQQ